MELLCVFSCSVFVPDHKSKVPVGSASANSALPDKIDFPKITPKSLNTEDM